MSRLGYAALALAVALTALLITGALDSCHASRLYPYVGVAWRHELDSARNPDATFLLRAGVPVSLGRFAFQPSLSLNQSRIEVGAELRFLLRKPD